MGINSQQWFLHLYKAKVKTFTKSCPVNHVTQASNQICEVMGARFLSQGHIKKLRLRDVKPLAQGHLIQCTYLSTMISPFSAESSSDGINIAWEAKRSPALHHLFPLVTAVPVPAIMRIPEPTSCWEKKWNITAPLTRVASYITGWSCWRRKGNHAIGPTIMPPDFVKGQRGRSSKKSVLLIVCFLNYFLPTLSKRNCLFHSRRQQSTWGLQQICSPPHSPDSFLQCKEHITLGPPALCPLGSRVLGPQEKASTHPPL